MQTLEWHKPPSLSSDLPNHRQHYLYIIQDAQNNAKGFTSRLLWFFPKPVFCKIGETILSEDEANEVHTFKLQLSE